MPLLTETTAHSVIELTLSPHFERKWPSLYAALQLGKVEVSQWQGLHLREATELSLRVIRVHRYGASGKRRDPLESWLVWSGQSELELSEVWATYKRRFSIEIEMKLNMTDPLGISSSLPPLYANWMSQALQGNIPAETKATCENCAMCNKAAPNASQNLYFNPRTKCCTYLPELPNFLVGRILLEPDPSAVLALDKLQARIVEGIAVTPFGVVKPPRYDLLYSQSSNFFGKSEAMLCPYYIEEGGLCGVWKHRNSICATWFCKHNRGATGFTFWKTIQKLLTNTERCLAIWCILQLDMGKTAMKRLFPLDYAGGNNRSSVDANQLDGLKDEADYRRMWGKWHGRETEFYQHSAHLISSLTWEQVLEIGGVELQAIARLAQEAYRSLMSEELPGKLQTGSFQIIQAGGDKNLIETYSPYDPISMPRQLLEVLNYFDGRLTEEAVQAIYDEKDINLTASLVRKLADFQVLLAVDEPEGNS